MAKSYDLNLLVALDALIATGSVTTAARRLHLSTPAMSHTLARIREAFGDPILVRAGRRLVPTERAQALAEPVRALVAQAQALRDPLQGRPLAALERCFVLRMPEGMAVVFGAPLAQALMAQMPRASLQIWPEGQGGDMALRDGGVDIELGRGPAGVPEAEVLVLSQQRLVGAARRGHPLLARRVTARRLAAAVHVAVQARPGEASALDAALAAHGLARRVVLSVPNAYAALAAAARTELVACVAQRTAEAVAEPMGLVLFELAVSALAEPLTMSWHPRHAADPAHQWLRECVRAVLGDPRWVRQTLRGLGTAETPAAPLE